LPSVKTRALWVERLAGAGRKPIIKLMPEAKEKNSLKSLLTIPKKMWTGVR